LESEDHKRSKRQDETDTPKLIASMLTSCTPSFKLALRNKPRFEDFVDGDNYVELYNLMKETSINIGPGSAALAIQRMSRLTQTGKFAKFDAFVQEFQACVADLKAAQENPSHARLNSDLIQKVDTRQFEYPIGQFMLANDWKVDYTELIERLQKWDLSNNTLGISPFRDNQRKGQRNDQVVANDTNLKTSQKDQKDPHDRGPIICNNCGCPGHTSKACSQPRAICAGCGKAGHCIAVCRTTKRIMEEQRNSSSNSGKPSSFQHTKAVEGPSGIMKIDEKKKKRGDDQKPRVTFSPPTPSSQKANSNRFLTLDDEDETYSQEEDEGESYSKMSANMIAFRPVGSSIIQSSQRKSDLADSDQSRMIVNYLEAEVPSDDISEIRLYLDNCCIGGNITNDKSLETNLHQESVILETANGLDLKHLEVGDLPFIGKTYYLEAAPRNLISMDVLERLGFAYKVQQFSMELFKEGCSMQAGYCQKVGLYYLNYSLLILLENEARKSIPNNRGKV
jgi:hypothetical protein